MFPYNNPMQGQQQSSPFSSLMGGAQTQPQPYGMQMPQQQQAPQSPMPMPPMAQNPLQMQGGAPQGSMPSPTEQDSAMQRLLAEMRARQGAQQSPGNNLQSMLGL